MKVTTVPASRFGWQGQTLEYTVKADGASEVSATDTCADGLRVRIMDTRQVDDGVEPRSLLTSSARCSSEATCSWRRVAPQERCSRSRLVSWLSRLHGRWLRRGRRPRTGWSYSGDSLGRLGRMAARHPRGARGPRRSRVRRFRDMGTARGLPVGVRRLTAAAREGSGGER
jgi:hypothetical protein